LREYGGEVRVVLQAAPGLVEQVERGEIDGPTTRSLVERYLQPLLAEGVDTLVLGCTHYPFLAQVIQQTAGPTVTVIDPAVAVARELARRLIKDGLETDSSRDGTEEFWTTGDPDEVGRVTAELWGRVVDMQPLQVSTTHPH
jgi:glutamate racemase